ncbi:hypothetical protein [Nostoc piscinale]|nr:hypothetical protein [Nostoc piscinale]
MERQEAEGSPDEKSFIAKHESGTGIFTQHFQVRREEDGSLVDLS